MILAFKRKINAVKNSWGHSRVYLVSLCLLPLIYGCQPNQTTDGTPPDPVVAARPVPYSQPNQRPNAGQDIVVGNSVTGEQCTLVDFGTRLSGGNIGDYQVRCAGWEEPSGVALLFDVGVGARLEDILGNENLPIADRNLESCRDLEPVTTIDNAPLLIQRCRSVDGWPQLLIGQLIPGKRQNKVAVGFGFNHLAPIYEHWFAVVAGKRETLDSQAVGTNTKLIRLAERDLSPGGRLLKLDDIRLHKELVKLATAHNHAGDFSSAEETHRRAVDIQRRFLDRYAPAVVVAMAAIALNMSDQSRFEDADGLFRSVAEHIRSGTREQRARFQSYRGLHLANSGKIDDGLELIRSSRALMEQSAGDKSPDAGYRHFLEGGILSQAGDQQGAIRSLEAALAIFDGVGDPIWIAFIKENLGEVHSLLGNYAKARAYFLEARDPLLVAFGKGIRYARNLTKFAVTEREDGRMGAAIASFRQAIETARADAVAAKYLDVDDVAPYLDILIGAANNERANSEELLTLALAAMQAPRDRTTGRAIQLMAARLATTDPAIRSLAKTLQDTANKRQSLRFDLAREQFRENDDERDPDLLQSLKNDVANVEEEVKRYERELQATAPRYGRLVAPATLSRERLTELLAPGEGLIRVMPTRDALYVIFINHNGDIGGHKAAVSSADLHTKVSELRNGLDPERGAGFVAFDRALAHRFYEWIFAPLTEELSSIRHLVYVPGGALTSLPPAVFVRTPPSGDPTDWLIRQFSISTLPTINALEQLRTVAAQSKARQPFLGVGDPTLPGESALTTVEEECLDNGYVDPALLRELSPLPETRGELEQISAILKSSPEDLLLGDLAREPSLRLQNLQDYRIVAFATHALLPEELVCQSEPALVMTPPDQARDDDDGLLTSSDIAQLQFDADWILLSACNTGGPEGKLGGESFTGLARAFFYAGARTLLVSHWAVESEPTVVLTTSTFDGYADGSMAKAEALRQAQLSMINDPEATGSPDDWTNAHPALWAAFTIVGDGGHATN